MARAKKSSKNRATCVRYKLDNRCEKNKAKQRARYGKQFDPWRKERKLELAVAAGCTTYNLKKWTLSSLRRRFAR